jgi:flagellar biogenesis protein FliO
MLAIVAWLARKRLARLAQGTNLQRSVNVIETTRLSEHARLTVIHFKGRELLVAHGSGSIALLADHPVEDEGSKNLGTEPSGRPHSAEQQLAGGVGRAGM